MRPVTPSSIIVRRRSMCRYVGVCVCVCVCYRPLYRLLMSTCGEKGEVMTSDRVSTPRGWHWSSTTFAFRLLIYKSKPNICMSLVFIAIL